MPGRHFYRARPWEETYSKTLGETRPGEGDVHQHQSWEVVGLTFACEAPRGSFECLHLRRTRTEGGLAIKDFFFARGVGKVRETGDNQTEELSACGR